MKKLSFKVDGKEIKWEEKSHAQVFRNFWAHFINADLNKTLETIEGAGIRTSTDPEFVAKNGSRKKHIPITDGLYVYAHLTPKAMDKLYEKFLFVWEGGTYETAPQETTPDAPVDEEPKVETAPKDEEELTPQQKAALTRKRNKEAKDAKIAALKAERDAKEQEQKSQQLSSEELEEVEL